MVRGQGTVVEFLGLPDDLSLGQLFTGFLGNPLPCCKQSSLTNRILFNKPYYWFDSLKISWRCSKAIFVASSSRHPSLSTSTISIYSLVSPPPLYSVFNL
ncbi:hypothetical protein IMY05_016G0153400 [Salix suchowensis]|nr:hypothetical protein IMY05_016G0153400 [Salix suchowensis]